ncbi:MAG TPA: ABC transporter substrate-binding protein [Methylomusa anaerophila]|uniref:ABC transporter substrate-binding protein n=1 Tax=Methylomusa anaerophila TaxID=1930071 RepID=UPI002CE4816C|nr:ABC transporter substrate-binding protein [Methylomusa anaerophila]HML88433.1 ABC transporter substrate-binding protein [Methylomusa anaerophila]
MISFMVFGCGRTADIRTSSGEISYQIVDAGGNVIEMPGKPKRIVTLAASTDTIILGMLPTENLVAVNALLDDPVSSNIVKKAQKIPEKIKNPSAERILSLQPDLVIVPDWSDAVIVDSLRDLGLKVVVCKGPRSVAEVRETVRLLAKAIGEENKGSQIIAQMDEKLREIKNKVDKIPLEKRKTVVLISLMTSYGGIGSPFDDMCGYAGVINGAGAAGIKNGQVLAKERLIAINPDILILPMYNDHGTYDVESFYREFLEDPSLQTLTAIKEKRLYMPREGYMYNVSQDIVFGIQEIALAAYGKDFAQPADCHISVSGE